MKPREQIYGSSYKRAHLNSNSLSQSKDASGSKSRQEGILLPLASSLSKRFALDSNPKESLQQQRQQKMSYKHTLPTTETGKGKSGRSQLQFVTELPKNLDVIKESRAISNSLTQKTANVKQSLNKKM